MIKIAIAEDSKEVRKNLVQILEILGEYDILFDAANGKEVLENLDPNNLPDVILMDIEMPEMDGIEATKKIVAKHPEVAVVMLTAFHQKDRVFNALKSGARGYLLKGEKPKVIVEAIAQAKEGRMPMTPEIAVQTLQFFRDQDQTENAQKDYKLTDRELEILGFLCQALSYKQIAGKCEISTKTVNTHVENVYRKLEVHSAVEAINLANKNKWF